MFISPSIRILCSLMTSRLDRTIRSKMKQSILETISLSKSNTNSSVTSGGRQDLCYSFLDWSTARSLSQREHGIRSLCTTVLGPTTLTPIFSSLLVRKEEIHSVCTTTSRETLGVKVPRSTFHGTSTLQSSAATRSTHSVELTVRHRKMRSKTAWSTHCNQLQA